jgi:hypothetical protein
MVPEKLPETPFWFILCAPAGLRLGIPSTGEMAEWFKVHAWKACVRLQPYRGFESLSLRQVNSKYATLEQLLFLTCHCYHIATLPTNKQVFLRKIRSSVSAKLKSHSAVARVQPSFRAPGMVIAILCLGSAD